MPTKLPLPSDVRKKKKKKKTEVDHLHNNAVDIALRFVALWDAKHA